jgi:NADH-quinone oxidoreductase subunit J
MIMEPALLLPQLVFYLFATILVLSSVMVISARNSVHSVLFLILSFFTAAALFILLGAEFIAMLLIIVYVGAVAVLFLFVVMMLNINFAEMQKNFVQYLPVGLAVAAVILTELVIVITKTKVGEGAVSAAATKTPTDITNTEALGMLLYTHYAFIFELAGLILLVAMVGAIVLSLRVRTGVRKQNIGGQLARTTKNSLKIIKGHINDRDHALFNIGGNYFYHRGQRNFPQPQERDFDDDGH